MFRRSAAALAITLHPTGTVGAEVRGVNLSKFTDSDVEEIKKAWYKHDVLIFRGQDGFTDQNLVDFSKRFGELDPPPNQGAGVKSPDGFPELYVVSNVMKDGKPIGALGNSEAKWHTDMSYCDLPPDASMLFSKEIPPTGGDTWFCCMKAALKALPADLREKVMNLKCKHDGTYDSSNTIRKGMAEVTDPSKSVGAIHPMVTQHPESGDHSLYLGRRLNAYVDGWTVEESEKLLDEVWKYATLTSYAHKWKVHDLVMWDNRTTMHRRDSFSADHRRVMHRSQVKNTKPIIAANPKLRN